MPTLLTPTTGTDAIELSRNRFRKQILPKGSINYQGRTITFDDAYLTDLARSFRDRAYDQVPFVLADTDNRHTMDPERYRGEVIDVEVADDGLYATLDLAPDAADLVRRNPKLGVSARLVPQTDRADGRRMGMAMQHVLGTLDPRVTGLAAWQEVELSHPGGEVIDLTRATYTQEVTVTTPATAETASEPTRNRFLRWLLGNGTDTELTDAELAEVIAEAGVLDDEPTPTPEPAREPAGAALSTPVTPGTVDLAVQARIDEQQTQLAQMRAELATQRYEAERGEYVRRGCPPALVELARPLLEAADPMTIELSNPAGDTRTVDAAAIARQMLDSMAGYIDLARERGHAFAPDAGEDTAAEQDKARALADRWAKQSG